MGRRNYEAAAGEFSQVLEIDGSHTGALLQRARARGRMDDVVAIRDYDSALDLDPDYDEPWLYRGIGKFRLGDPEGACADWHRALELGHELAQGLIDDMCGE